MTLKGMLSALVNVIVDEAASNPDFRGRIETALDMAKPAPSPAVKTSNVKPKDEKRKGGRRAPAIVDPIDLARHGQGDLREKLAALDIEKLLDVVAQYGMDPGKLVMKWKDRERVIDRIVEVALARATKGNAFRAE